MPGLPSKAKKKSGKKSGKKSSGKKKSAKSKSATPSGPTREVDMLDPAAMYNLYYIAHGAVEALEIRGFGWAGAPKGKKKGKKKKK